MTSDTSARDPFLLPEDHQGSVMVINVVTPKPGKLDEFLEVQLAQLQRFKGQIPGLRGSRVHRALDGRNAVMIALFESADDHRRWIGSDLFAEHLARIRPLIERAEPAYYEVVHEAGQL